MRRELELTPQQREELRAVARHGPTPHIRIKALAVYNVVGRGIPRDEVADFLCVERRSVGSWALKYLAHGLAAFSIKSGRGRRSQVKGEEVEDYIRQAPFRFGIPRTRWTLAMLGKVVPSLMGMTEEGIRKALSRLGYGYKRGQPAVHSPDPLYGEKRGLWCKD